MPATAPFSLAMPTARAVGALMRQVAADEIVPRWRNLKASDIKEKTPGDWVTEADLSSEARLSQGLLSLLPGSRIVGEEAMAAEPGVLDGLGAAGATWIVDPLDGTNAFKRGDPGFGMLVALVQDGDIQAGWLLNILRDELVFAIGGTAYRQHGAEPVAALPPADAVGRVCRFGSSRERPGALLGVAERLQAQGWQAQVSGYCVKEYLDLATRSAEVLLTAHSDVWDHAAGVAVVRALGGEVLHQDGTLWRATPDAHLKGTVALMEPGSAEAILSCLPLPENALQAARGP